jgi:hypothetical protein
MLDRIRELGGQISTSAARVAETVGTSVKDGAGTVAAQAGEAMQATRRKASELGDRAGTAATREAVVQMRDMLALAAEELRARPIIDGPVTLTAKVDLMLTALQIEFVLHPDTRVLHVPKSATDSPDAPPVLITMRPADPSPVEPAAPGGSAATDPATAQTANTTAGPAAG